MREATYTINGVVLGASPYVITQAPKGVGSAPPARTSSTPKPQQDGAYGDRGYAGPKTIELAGLLYGDGTSWATLNARRDALIAAAYCKTDTVMTIVGDGLSRQITVRSVGPSPVEVVEGNASTVADWRAEWEALDPRLYSTALYSVVAGLPVASGGVTFNMAAPITFGAAGSGGTVLAPNAGSAPAPWTARLDGPLTNPSIIHQEQGLTLMLVGSVLAGEFLTVDVLSRSILLGGTASRYGFLAAPAWFLLNPGTNTIRFNAVSGTGTLTFNWRDAWW
jgi:hypothetical protein